MGWEGNEEEDPLELNWLRLLSGRRQELPNVRLGGVSSTLSKVERRAEFRGTWRGQDSSSVLYKEV